MSDQYHSIVQKLSRLVLILAGGATVYWWLMASGTLENWLTGDGLRRAIEEIEIWGPLLVIGLMTMAVVLSPIPSAPIALAAGAVYGHLWGTIYVVVGAELGALVAFGLARYSGRDLIDRWLGRTVDLSAFATQNTLMGIVFVSRLLPFLSFDLFSYAAGLTALTIWRFALATVAGIIPASFLLAHFGGEVASGEGERIAWALVILGGLGFSLVAWRSYRARKNGQQTSSYRENL